MTILEAAASINLIGAIVGLMLGIAAVTVGADNLLGRRIKNHQKEILDAILPKVEEVKTDVRDVKSDIKEVKTETSEIKKDFDAMDTRVTRLEDHVAPQNEKISYIQGQSDTLFKILTIKDGGP